MKRRNSLSGLLAAPLASKARLARFFARKPVELSNAPIGNRVMWNRADPGSPEARFFMDRSETVGVYADALKLTGYSLVIGRDKPTSELYSAPCCLRRGHKGPHVLLVPR